jgi:molybdopterin molybdotransferase
MVGLEIYLRPALLRMQGHSRVERPTIQAVLAEPIKRKNRLQFVRSRLERRHGEVHAALTGPQGSGLITAMAWANALLIIPTGSGSVAVGERVTALALEPEWLLGYDKPAWHDISGLA